MIEPTKKQLEVLKTLNPFIGNITYEQAAKELGISRDAVEKRMRNLKKRCPEIYWKFRELRKKINEGQQAVSSAHKIDPDNFDFLNIKETF